uniref:Uncharacterized protein n=1 Tax=Desertifilum tharense IPPAS B-1220 TaxID=1781255 RepID=A0ACD5GMK6_9CYAN
MNPEQPKTRIALFMSALDGGGAERIMLYLARGFVEAGLEVDLVLAKAEGAFNVADSAWGTRH